MLGTILACLALTAVCALTIVFARALQFLEERLRQFEGAALKSEIDDLRGALDVHIASNRREFGALHKRAGLDARAQTVTLDGETVKPCENWLLAQKEGPRSQAAQCECAYCKERRDAKRRARDELVPKTAGGLARFTKENAG